MYFITNNLWWIYVYFELVRVIFRVEVPEIAIKNNRLYIENIKIINCLVLPHIRLHIDKTNCMFTYMRKFHKVKCIHFRGNSSKERLSRQFNCQERQQLNGVVLVKNYTMAEALFMWLKCIYHPAQIKTNASGRFGARISAATDLTRKNR